MPKTTKAKLVGTENDQRFDDIEYMVNYLIKTYSTFTQRNVFGHDLNTIATSWTYPSKAIMGKMRMHVFDDDSLSEKDQARIAKLISTYKPRKMRGSTDNVWIHFIEFQDKIKEQE